MKKVLKKLIAYRLEKDPEIREKTSFEIFELLHQQLNGEQIVKVVEGTNVYFADRVEQTNPEEIIFIRDEPHAVKLQNIRMVVFYASG